MTHARSFLLLVTVAALAAVVLAAEPAMAAKGSPVTVLRDESFGRVLAARDHQALYFWSKEPAGTERCVGACARLWPPLIVRTASAVPRNLAGVKGVFGVIRRPDGRLQVTHNRRPIYTYVHEGPNQVLCNNVDGWFVVRA